jgi:glutathionyl-hydroquinone reductase
MIENRLVYNSFLAGNYMTYADIILALVMKQFESIYKSHKFINIKRVVKFVESSGLFN